MNTIFLRRVNLGQDALVKTVENQTVVEFSVADNRKYKDPNGHVKEIVTWYRCSYWTNRTEIADYLMRGSCVNIIGKLQAQAYTNKNNQPACDLRVVVFEIDLLTKKEQDDQAADQDGELPEFSEKENQQ